VKTVFVHRYNQAKPKSDLEKKIYEILSHKNWGSSSTLMNEVAKDSYDHDKCKLRDSQVHISSFYRVRIIYFYEPNFNAIY